jgi:hypothetical protein
LVFNICGIRYTRMKRTPYDYRQERYFNWAAGIRATDENHEVAKALRSRRKQGKGSAGSLEGGTPGT